MNGLWRGVRRRLKRQRVKIAKGVSIYVPPHSTRDLSRFRRGRAVWRIFVPDVLV